MKSWPLGLHDPGAVERVGIILNGAEVVELNNVHCEPSQGFHIDVAELLPFMETISGTWHTHVGVTATSDPSEDDIQFFLRWPELQHTIISPRGEKTYFVYGQRVVECE